MDSIQITDDRKGLIFDLDGTLIDTMPLHFQSWQSVAGKLGFTFTEKLFYELAGTPTTGIIDHLNREQNLNLVHDEILSLKYSDFLKMLPEAKPVKAVVDVIHRYHGILPMSVGTGGAREIALQTLSIHKLDSYFPVIVFAEDVENHKPAPDTFLQCASRMGVEPEFCHVFEDGDQGIRAAESAGMTFTDVRPSVYRQRELLNGVGCPK